MYSEGVPAVTVFKIGGHDYTQFVIHEGFEWQRNDLDSDASTRTKDGVMRRQRITTKRKMTVSLSGMTREQIAQLDDDLSPVTVEVTYEDLHGPMTKTFYCSGMKATMVTSTHEGVGSWAADNVTLTEV